MDAVEGERPCDTDVESFCAVSWAERREYCEVNDYRVLLALTCLVWTRVGILPPVLFGAVAALGAAEMASSDGRTCLVWRRHGTAGATALRLWTYWHGQRPLLRGVAKRGCWMAADKEKREGIESLSH